MCREATWVELTVRVTSVVGTSKPDVRIYIINAFLFRQSFGEADERKQFLGIARGLFLLYTKTD